MKTKTTWRKLLSILLCLVMVVSMLPTVALATGGDEVAEVGGDTYSTLRAAIDAANGNTVTLLKNTAENITIDSGETVALNLNGYKLTNDGDHTIVNRGTLTIVDNSAAKTGTVDNVTDAKAALVNYGTATLSGGTFTRSQENSSTNSYYVVLNETGDLTINRASVINTSTSSTAVESRSNAIDDPVKLTINEGAVISNNFTAVKNGYIGELFINGGTITGNNGNKAVQTYGTTTITGKAVLNGDVEATDWTANDIYKAELIIAGGEINGNVRANALKYSGQVGTDAKVVITGGTINGTVRKTYQETDIVEQSPDYANADITITGGTFAQEVPEAFCAEDFEVVNKTDGTYGVVKCAAQVLGSDNASKGKYESFADAVHAAENGDTIKLLDDVTMDKTYFGAAVGQILTLDLNGFTLTRTWQPWAGEDTTTKSVIYNQGTLTIKDSSASKTGKIQGHSDTSGASGWNQEFKGAAISNASGAVLNLEGGTVTRGDADSFGYYTVYNMGTFNMSGGLITNGSCASAMVCNVAGGSKFVMTGGELKQEGFQTLKNENGSTVEISGGTLTSGDRTLQNYGTATIEGGTFNGDIQVPASGNLSITKGIINGDLYGSSAGTGTINISGGTISSTVKVLGSDNTLKGQYETLASALVAVQEGQTIQLSAGTFSEGDLQLPATLKNVTIKGADEKTTILKEMSLRSADGTTLCYEGVTFDGIVFDNTNIVIVGWRSGAESYKDWTITNCEFKNIVRSSANEAAVHFNVDGSKALNGFTFTNNVIDGVSGGNNSGIYANVTGSITIENNTINNVAFRPYIAMFNCNDGVEDSLSVEGNTFSESANGRAQASVTTAGNDEVTLKVNNNIFKDITAAQQICYWGFNMDNTTADLGYNYYDIDLLANPGKIYFNSEASNVQDLYEYGVYPLYTALTADGKIDTASLVTAPPAVAERNGTEYYALQAAIDSAPDGATVTLLKDTTGYVAITKDLTLDLNGKTLNGVINMGGETQALKATAGKVTVKNGTIKGKVNAWNACEMTFAADVTIENTSLNGKSCFGISVWGDGTYGQSGCKTPKVVFNGKIRTIGKGSGIITNGSDKSKPIIIINESAEIISDGIGVYLPSGSLTVNGGKITGATAIYFKSTDLDIRGGVFTGTGEKTEYAYNGSGANATGDAVVIDNCNYPGGIDTVKISGGKFTSNNANAVGSYAGNGNTEALTGFISGGTFSSDPSEYCAAGYYMDASGNGDYPYTVKAGNKPNTAPIIVKDSANASVAEDVPTEHGVNTNAVQVDGVAEALENRKDELVKQSGVNTEDATKTEVAVRVDVKLTSVDTETKILTFTAKPVATVTVTKANGAPIVEKDVPVENSMLRGNITVQLPLPENFSPKQIKHTSEDGYVEYFINANEGAKRGAKTFKIEDGCAVFTITHFSTFELSGDITYVAPVYSGSGYDYYTITATVQGNGSVSPSGRIVLREDGTRTYTFTPDEGYAVSDVKVDGKSIGAVNSYTFEDIDRDHTIEVSFVKLSAPAAAPAEPSAPESSTAPEAPEAPEVSEAPEASAPENSEAEEPSVPADTKPAERGSFPALPVVGAVVALLAIVLLLIRKKK